MASITQYFEKLPTLSLENDSTGNCNLEHELSTAAKLPSRDWQIGLDLKDCMLNVYENNRWSDMVIRCGDGGDGRLLKANKVILASRSPVFEAMLFGPCSDQKTEYDFPDARVDVFDKMLRYMYCDDADLLDVDDALNVMEMADMYQITRLVNECADFLRDNLETSNVCKSLDIALKYNLTDLRDACCGFIDENAKDVLMTDGFLDVSNETLTCILKGDTFYAPEDEIFQRVEDWAKLQLATLWKNENGTNLRDVMGQAFYYLRLPQLSTVSLMHCIKGKGYFSVAEYEELIDCNIGSISETSFMSNIRRVPSVETIGISFITIDGERTGYVDQSVKIHIARDVYVSGFDLHSPQVYLKYEQSRFGFTNSSPTSGGQRLPEGLTCKLKAIITIEDVEVEKKLLIYKESSKLKLDRPVFLKKSSSPINLRIQITPVCSAAKVTLCGDYGTHSSDTVTVGENGGQVKSEGRMGKSANISIISTNDSIVGIKAIHFRNCPFRERTVVEPDDRLTRPVFQADRELDYEPMYE